jgi:3-hydroxyisobutyrate dehydrogenase-like beta-hydroxyacid dehydrogenase
VGAKSAGEVAADSDLVVFSLPTTTALSEVSAEIAAGAHRGLLCLETGTFPLEAKTAARSVLAARGVELMDTPLSGTGLQAADATLVVFASGSSEGFERAQPVFDAIGRSTHYLGEFGNGSRMKYIANLLVAVHNLATAEAHALGLAAGLDPALVQEVMTDGVGSSKIFEIRGPMMVNDDYPTAARLDIILKDARIIKEFAGSVGAPTPLLDAAIPIYVESSAAGLGDLDAAALCRYLENLGGIAR